jgi:hypothetical protein
MNIEKNELGKIASSLSGRYREHTFPLLIYDWQPHAIRKRGRPKIRRKDDVRGDLKDLGIYNWTTRTQDRSSWKEIVDQAKTFKKWSCRAL